MGVVVFKLESEEADAVRGFLKLVDAEKKAATAVGDVTAAGKTANREYANLTRQFSNMEQAADRAWNKQRAMLREAREARFTEPARLRGYDTSDSGAVDFARYQKAQDLRQRRARLRDDTAFGSEMDLVSFRADLAGRATTAAADKRAADAGQLLTLRASIARTASLDDKARRERAEEAAGRLTDLRGSVARTAGLSDRVRRDQATSQQSLSQQLSLNQFESTLAKQEQFRARLTKGLTIAAAATAATFALVTSSTAKVVEGFTTIGQANADYYRAVRPLLSTGDNLARPGRVQDRVLALSGGTGMSLQEAAGSLYNLESSTSNLPSGDRSKLLGAGLSLTQVAGGNLDDNIMALVKAWQVYGKEVGTVEQLQSKLFLTADKGVLTMQDLATLLPDVLPAAKAFGISLDEVGGALITATQVGGRTEKTFTGIRNVIVRMSEAQKEGLQLTGSFTDKLTQLSKVPPEQLKRIFGDEAISVISALAQKSAEVASNVRAVAATTGTELRQKSAMQLADPAHADAMIIDRLQASIANADVEVAKNPTFRRAAIKLRAAELGYDLTVDPIAKAMVPDEVKKTRIAADALAGGDFTQAGLAKTVDNQLALGTPEGRALASYLRLSYGQQFKKVIGSTTVHTVSGASGLPTRDLQMEEYSGPKEAEGFANLVSQGYDLTDNSYLEYIRLKRNNPGAATAFLNKRRGGTPVNVGAATQSAGGGIDTGASTAIQKAADNLSVATQNLKQYTDSLKPQRSRN
jgi:TP901 family phage tail tape measure protein